MSHRSKLYGIYEDEGEFETIIAMSKADKMFEDLGYKKNIYPKEPLKPFESYDYEKDNIYIEFDGYHNSVYIGLMEETVEDGDVELSMRELNAINEKCFEISMQELQAINEKCKELGWIDE